MTKSVNNEKNKCSKLVWLSNKEIYELGKHGKIESTTMGILNKFMNGEIGVYVECDWSPNESNKT